jgi:phosphonoacetaldehyde hydrolase
VPTPTGVRLVVFDWAGTVIDFGCRGPTGAFVAAFAERGVAVTLAEARGPMGLHKKDHLRAMLRDIPDRWRTVHGRDWTEADVDDLYRLVTPMQVAAAKRYSRLVPGVMGCVAELRRRGVKVAGTTGYFRAAAEAVSAAAREQGYAPDFTICADEVPAGRPAPWMIFRAMEALDVYPPSAVVKVGDTVIDVEDGLNAGAWSVAVIDSGNEMGLSEEEFGGLSADEKESRRAAVRRRFEAAGAHAVVNDLGELPAVIGGIERVS